MEFIFCLNRYPSVRFIYFLAVDENNK